MGLNNTRGHLLKYLNICVVLVCCGCASWRGNGQTPTRVYEQGYRAGIKEQMDVIAAKFQGGQFPYYHWAAPIVQDLRVPAHIAHGVFIPEHNEIVLIKPGEWQKSPAYPIAIQEKEDYEQKQIDHGDTTNLTVLP